MSSIAYTWVVGHPPVADVYTTRRNESKYLTLRYWDGDTWWEIACSASRGGVPFTWPKRSRTKRPSYLDPRRMSLRKISARLGDIQWGEPYRVYNEKETLAHLVNTGVLPADWRTYYQAGMRSAAGSARRITRAKDWLDPEKQCGQYINFTRQEEKALIKALMKDQMELVVPENLRDQVAWIEIEPNAEEGLDGSITWKYSPAKALVESAHHSKD